MLSTEQPVVGLSTCVITSACWSLFSHSNQIRFFTLSRLWRDLVLWSCLRLWLRLNHRRHPPHLRRDTTTKSQLLHSILTARILLGPVKPTARAPTTCWFSPASLFNFLLEMFHSRKKIAFMVTFWAFKFFAAGPEVELEKHKEEGEEDELLVRLKN